MSKKTNTHPVTPFDYQSHQIRIAKEDDGSVWFAAKDVCAAMAISWHGNASTLRNIKEPWKRVLQHQTPRGKQGLLFISEPAVYKLAFRSDKPEAEAFTEWVAAEVLPQIRKTGRYGSAPAPLDAEAIRLKAERNAIIRAFEAMDGVNKAGGCVFHLKQFVYYRRIGLLRFEAARLIGWKIETAEAAEASLQKIGIIFPAPGRTYAEAIHAAIEDATFDATLRQLANAALPGGGKGTS